MSRAERLGWADEVPDRVVEHVDDPESEPILAAGVDYDVAEWLTETSTVTPVVLAGGDTMTGFVLDGEVFAASVSEIERWDDGVDRGDDVYSSPAQ